MWGIVPVFLLALVAHATCDYPKLAWTDKYSVDVTKYSIVSKRIEEIRYWRTFYNSRTEFNEGAMNSYIISAGNQRTIHHYEVNSETVDDGDFEENELVCNLFDDKDLLSGPEDLLPDVQSYDFTVDGEEKLRDFDCVRFITEDDGVHQKLWATYLADKEAWRPVRYEYIEYNNWLGSLTAHDIWDFDNYDTDFDEVEVFSLPKSCLNVESTVKHKKHDMSVIKHLKFINHHNQKHVDHIFNAFKTTFGKTYADAKEESVRKNLLRQRMRLVQETNRKKLTYKLAINHFADRTPEELKRSRGLKPRPEGANATHAFPHTLQSLKHIVAELPKEYDARTEGFVSPVQDQGTCGSCWTFGTTAAAEGALARKRGQLMHLANQALIDCSWGFSENGCAGGSDVNAYKWMMKYGMPSVADYGTYKNADGFCHIEDVTHTYEIKGFVDVTPNSVPALKTSTVKYGPVSVSIHASEAFTLYSSGVFYDTDCKSDKKSLDHEVAVVGYGDQYGETFWIVKNSWGPEWGVSGYIHIAAKDNNCGVMTEPTYVLA